VSLKKLHDAFVEVFGPVSFSKLSKIKVHKLHIRKIHAIYEHPRKWIGDNPQYYRRFLFWVISQPQQVQAGFKFFDEVRIDQTRMSCLLLALIDC